MNSRLLSLGLLALAALLPPGKLHPSAALALSVTAVAHFWWTHAFSIRALNWRFLLFFTGISVAVWFLLNGAGVTGIDEDPNFDPKRIGMLKRSDRPALRLYFEHEPGAEERYHKLGYESPPSFDAKPGNGADQARAWAIEHLQGRPPDRKISLLEEFFRTRFTYSLEPEWKSLDHFLFESRRGYCVHFSHAAHALLRQSGESVKIAYGYSGGSWNPWTKILTFRDSDAHSWLELLNQGTALPMRIDPTLWVTAIAREKTDFSEPIPRSTAIGLLGIALLAIFASLLARDPARQLNRLLPHPGGEPIQRRLRRFGEQNPAAKACAARVCGLYELLYFQDRTAIPRRWGAFLRLLLEIFQLRLWKSAGALKYLSRFFLGHPDSKHQSRTS